MNLQLEGKLCIVTGSTGDGIGKNIAEVLVQQGANVVINGRSQGSVDKTIATILKDNANNANVDASKLFGVPGDVASADGAAKFVEDVAAIESKLDTQVYGLVNNVGIFHVQDFAEISDEKWNEYYQTNTMSGVRLSRHYLPKMLSKDEGRILFISSECGVRPATYARVRRLQNVTNRTGSRSRRDDKRHQRHCQQRPPRPDDDWRRTCIYGRLWQSARYRRP